MLKIFHICSCGHTFLRKKIWPLTVRHLSLLLSASFSLSIYPVGGKLSELLYLGNKLDWQKFQGSLLGHFIMDGKFPNYSERFLEKNLICSKCLMYLQKSFIRLMPDIYLLKIIDSKWWKIKYVKHVGHLSNDVIWSRICVPHKTKLIAPPKQWSQFDVHSTNTCLNFLLNLIFEM